MKRIFWLILFLFTSVYSLRAQCEDIPAPSDFLVYDYAQMLSRQEVNSLANKLAAYARETSTQIAVVTETSLRGNDDFERSLCYYDKWGIGGSRENSNGVLIYVAEQDRKIRIMTGYGAEGFLPDAIAKRIIDNVITPAFRQGRYYAGLDRAAGLIMDYAQGEYTNEDSAGAGSGIMPMLIIIGFLILLIIILSFTSGHDDDDDDGGYWRGGRYDDPDGRGRRRRSRGGWIIMPGGGGGWNSGGGGGFGGLGGGGFGGFGGGLSGGGGAGGGW